MAKINLTDRKISALKPAPTGQRTELMDAIVPGLGIRVTDRGAKTFILKTRFPGSDQPARRALGEYPSMSLEEARAKAMEWRKLIARDVDPRDELEKAKRSEQRTRANTFGAVAEEYIARKISKTAKARASELEIRNELISRWATRPITEISRRDVVDAIETIAARAPYQAHNVFGHLRGLYNWAIGRDYGLENSPCDRLKPADLCGRKESRTRVLNDDELRSLWNAADALGYPYGPLIRLLAITGQRKSEVAEARWREIDLPNRLWTIPAERMKAASPHVVPLSDLAIELLQSLPRFARGDHLFTTTHGAKAVNGFSNAKERLDEAMGNPPPFVLHDVRRTVRTRLSGLPISSDVAELVIAHAKPGLRRVYDMHSFEDEKRRALDLWAARLRSIVEPAP